MRLTFGFLEHFLIYFYFHLMQSINREGDITDNKFTKITFSNKSSHLFSTQIMHGGIVWKLSLSVYKVNENAEGLPHFRKKLFLQLQIATDSKEVTEQNQLPFRVFY